MPSPLSLPPRHKASLSSPFSLSHNRLRVVGLDEARSPLLFHELRPESIEKDTVSLGEEKNEAGLSAHNLAQQISSPNMSSSKSNKNNITMRAPPTTTSIQYVEDPSEIDRMFKFDRETLGLFGTARQKRKKSESRQRSNKEGEKKNSHSRAVVHSAIDLRTMEHKVIKIIEKNKLPASSGGDRLWRRLCHKLLRVSKSHGGLMHITDVLETDTTFYLVSECLQGGELFEFLLMERAVPEELCKYLIKQILHALDFLHSNSLLHRDVKPENLMFRRQRPFFSSDGSAMINNPGSTVGSLASTTDSLGDQIHQKSSMMKNHRDAKYHRVLTSLECSQCMSLEELRLQFELAVIDFDTCKMTDIPSSDYREICNGRRRLVGTYGYLAPEVLRGHEYTMQSDLWSVGVILYILMTGVPPVPMDLMVNARSALEVLQEVKRRGIDFCLAPFPDFPKAQDLCRSLLEFDPSRRTASARYALDHLWLTPSASNAIPFNPFPSTLLVKPEHHHTKNCSAASSPRFYRHRPDDFRINLQQKKTDTETRRDHYNKSGGHFNDCENCNLSPHRHLISTHRDNVLNSPPPLKHRTQQSLTDRDTEMIHKERSPGHKLKLPLKLEEDSLSPLAKLASRFRTKRASPLATPSTSRSTRNGKNPKES